tara:strand:- start:207 stop:398 length:192 start_codon:yes stop_codon:yes gene_type:complete
MTKPTITSLNKEIHSLDTRTTALETENRIQFKDIYNRFRRIENILIGAFGATFLLLITIVIRM